LVKEKGVIEGFAGVQNWISLRSATRSQIFSYSSNVLMGVSTPPWPPLRRERRGFPRHRTAGLGYLSVLRR